MGGSVRHADRPGARCPAQPGNRLQRRWCSSSRRRGALLFWISARATDRGRERDYPASLRRSRLGADRRAVLVKGPASLLLVGMALGATGCFPPDFAEGLTCSERSTCPPGQFCDPCSRRCVARSSPFPDGGFGCGGPDMGFIRLPVSTGSGQVDILFVVDNSGSMAQEQENLGKSASAFLRGLRRPTGEPLEYRIAVASTDVGAGGQ